MPKLNLGSGVDYRKGYVNVDIHPAVALIYQNFYVEDVDIIADLNAGFPFRSGVFDEVLAAFGGASKTVDATRDETHGSKHGTELVLYRQRGRLGAPVNAYKFVDGGQGVLFWFDHGKKVTQIVVFGAKRTRAS